MLLIVIKWYIIKTCFDVRLSWQNKIARQKMYIFYKTEKEIIFEDAIHLRTDQGNGNTLDTEIHTIMYLPNTKWILIGL